MNRTLVEMARCLLIKSNLPPSFWAEAIATAAYIRNRSPSRSLDDSTPFETRFGYKADVSNLKIFGCKAYALNKDPGRSKLGPKSKPCVFVGYCDDSKAYRLWDPESRKIIKSRDVIFNEESRGSPTSEKQENFMEFQIYFREFETNPRNDEPEIQPENVHEDQQKSEMNPEIDFDDIIDDHKFIPQNDINEDQEFGIDSQHEIDDSERDQELEVQIKRGPGRPEIVKTGNRGRPSKRYQMVKVENVKEETNLIEYDVLDPTIEEAIGGPHAREWREAMQLEFDSLQKSDAWVLVERPANKRVINCKWVLRTNLTHREI